jgi:hypothetical protein
MSKVQGPHERDQRAHLPQAPEMEVPEVCQGQNAKAEITRAPDRKTAGLLRINRTRTRLTSCKRICSISRAKLALHKHCVHPGIEFESYIAKTPGPEE